MKVIQMLIAALLLVSASAFAAKPSPEDCPCFNASFNLYDALAIAPCANDESTITRSKGDVFFDIFYWLGGKTEGESCAVMFQVEDYGSEGNYCHYLHLFTNDLLQCQYGEEIEIENLAVEQIRACRVIAQTISRYSKSLPECN
jgi:hypothetical protein